MSDDYEDDYDDFGEVDDEDNEPIGCCENCECDVWECDGFFIEGCWYCGQCAWWILRG